MPNLFKVSEIVQHLGVSRRTVYYWCDKGMPFVEFENGGPRMFDPKKVDQWVAKRQAKSAK